jgi:hypothetical protein
MTGFPDFYNEENLDYFGRIATQRFHSFTRKIIGAIFRRIATQGFYFLQRRVSGLFWEEARQGFHTFTMMVIWTILGG